MIIVDSREPEFIKRKLADIGLDIKIQQLEVGDYIVKVKNYEIAIERKEINDYLTSLEQGRLQRQLYLLSHYYPLSYLIIIGYISEALLDRKFRREAYISSLVGASLKRAPDGVKGQVIVVNLETDFDFILYIYYLHKKLESGKLERIPLGVTNKSTPEYMMLSLYSCLPGVGIERAKKLYERFPTLESLLKASIWEIQSVLGEKVGAKVYKFLHKKTY